MAFLTSALSLRIEIKSFVSRSFLHSRERMLPLSHIRLSPICSTKASAAQFGEPEKLKNQVIIIKDKVVDAIPKAVKDVPWNKVENLMVERLILLGAKALKLSFVGWFIISSLSDALVSVAANQELIIPLGLLAGCLTCDFLKETLQEIFPGPEVKGLNRQFLGLSCFFLVLKSFSALLGLKSGAFLLHVANGGILQALWLFWGILWRDDGQIQQHLSVSPSEESK